MVRVTSADGACGRSLQIRRHRLTRPSPKGLPVREGTERNGDTKLAFVQSRFAENLLRRYRGAIIQSIAVRIPSAPPP
jgi:hypothetical protein